MRVGNQVRTVFGKFGPQIAAVIAGKPKLVTLNSGIGAPNHLKLQVSNNILQRQRRMGQEILVALASRLLTSKKNKKHSPFAGTGPVERPCQFQDGNTAGCIIVGPIVDFIPVDRLSNTEVIEMCAQQHHFVLQLRIPAGENGDYIARIPLFWPAAELEWAGNILNKPTIVAARLESELDQFRGDIGSRHQLIVGAAPAPLEGIAGQKPKFSADVIGQVAIVPGMLRPDCAGEIENGN